jgi:two-component system response regulator HydG
MNKTNHHILVVEDEDIIRLSIVKLLERQSYKVSEAVSVKAALSGFNLNNFDLIVSDLRLPGGSGGDFIRLAPEVPVLIMTSYASLRSAVEIMRQGAVDYISKPFDHEELVQSVKRILYANKSSEMTAFNSIDQLLGSSTEIIATHALLRKAAATDLSILIAGEIGTGKRLVAQAIHNISERKEKRFITINCPSASDMQFKNSLELAEKTGICTVFLANICGLAKSHQRAVIELTRNSKIHCIASTAKDIDMLCLDDPYRVDLFRAVNAIKIEVPALRERSSDIAQLANYFIEKVSQELSFPIDISEESIKVLTNYSWPGNITELKNTLYKVALTLDEGSIISPEHLHAYINGNSNTQDIAKEALTTSENSNSLSLEKYFIQYVLDNQKTMRETQLAQNLGISRKNLWQRRKKLNIPRPVK